jgi:Protein of unknown function (DUF1161)
MRPCPVHLAAFWLLAGGWGGVSAADICEPLRQRIEAQIAGTGALSFAVIVVNSEVPVAGKVVGTCAKGARKLVYVRGQEPGAAAAPARPAAPRASSRAKEENIITECRDGTVVRGSASCKS